MFWVNPYIEEGLSSMVYFREWSVEQIKDSLVRLATMTKDEYEAKVAASEAREKLYEENRAKWAKEPKMIQLCNPLRDFVTMHNGEVTQTPQEVNGFPGVFVEISIPEDDGGADYVAFPVDLSPAEDEVFNELRLEPQCDTIYAWLARGDDERVNYQTHIAMVVERLQELAEE